jgi:hypothetical protein
MVSRVPSELRPSCTARDQTSASCVLDDGTVVIYNLFHTAADARTGVVLSDAIAPDGGPCPPSTPPTENPVVCHYLAGTQRGVVRLGYTNKAGLHFYSIQWSPEGQPVTGSMSSTQTNPSGWATLTADWARLAALR